MTMIRKWFVLGALFAVLSNVAFARDIAVTELPQSVVQSIEKKFPGAKVIEAEEEGEMGRVEGYEVKIRLQDGKVMEIKLDQNGKILEQEREQEDNQNR